MAEIIDARATESVAAESSPAARSIRNFARAFVANRVGFLGFLMVAAVTLIAVIGPLFVPERLPTNLQAIYQPPSLSHPLGTDSEGRDILLQMLDGGRAVVFVGFVAALLSTAIAVVFGAVAAYLRGPIDSFIVTITDTVLTIPGIALLAVLSAYMRLDSPLMLAVIIGALSWPVLLRAVRAQVLSLREREFVEAARILDLGTPRVLFVEILPNMASFILMNFVIGMTNAIYALVGLYYLGLAPLGEQNWGIMLNLAWTRGAVYFEDSLFYILAPVIAISILQLGLVTMTRSLEEIVNPRLREG